MSSPPPSLRQRAGKKTGGTSTPEKASVYTAPAMRNPQQATKSKSEWDYKLALVVITVLAFATRFYKINYPDQVVFDEVHFGKVNTMILVFNPPFWLLLGLITFYVNLVCVILSSADVLLRCSPTICKTSLCIRRLAGWIRWPFPLR